MTIKLQKVKYKRNIIKWIVYELNIIVVKHHIVLISLICIKIIGYLLIKNN